jgi:hypothetical protein
VPGPGTATAALFRLAVAPSDAGQLRGRGATHPQHDEDNDLRSAPERCQDGRRWLGLLLWVWRGVAEGNPAPPTELCAAPPEIVRW